MGLRTLALFPLRAMGGLLDRVLAVVGAVGFSQLPAFIRNYEQRLGGHLDEAARHVSAWQTIADQTTAGNLQQLVAKFGTAVTPETLAVGRTCAADVGRLQSLQQSLDAISQASPWTRGWVFARHIDLDIARATAHNFAPSIVFDLESLVYALAGLILVTTIFVLFKLILARIGRGIARAFRPAARPVTPQPAGQES